MQEIINEIMEGLDSIKPYLEKLNKVQLLRLAQDLDFILLNIDLWRAKNNDKRN